MRVLLVDDEDNLRRLLAKVLKSGGFEVAEFSTSLEALSWSRNHRTDVLVTDVTLREIDGPTLAQSIARLNPDLLVVFISGYPVDIEAERKKHPRCAYLEKPFPPRNVLRTIAQLAEERERSDV